MKLTLKIIAFISFFLLIIFIGFSLYFFISTKNYNLDKTKLEKKLIKIDYYDQNGSVFASEFYGKNNDYIEISKLNKNTLNAFISIEDKRFYSHNGIDYKRIIGALINNVKSMSFKEGASTITQQLVKNTHLTSDKTLKRKFAEIKITMQLEKEYEKDEILEKYLNTIYFGNGAYGINSASKLYFNKSASELTLNEACLLAGIIKSPAKYSPIDNYDSAIERKNLVLKTMVNNNFISNSEFDSNKELPIKIYTEKENSGLASYILGVNKEFEKYLSLNPYLFNNNIKIYTYLDKNLQEKISSLNVANQEQTDTTRIIINSKNNGIIAFYTNNSILKRSPASCVKPWLVYAPMINDRIIKSSTIISDNEINYNGYSPQNYGGKCYGNVTIKTALLKSLNIPAVKLLNLYGIKKANDYTKKMNVNVENGNLSYALGNIEGGLTLKELCDCYSPFVNAGNYTPSAFISKIFINDNLVFNHSDNKTEVFSNETTYIINDILKECVKSGTAKNLGEFDYDVCSKTGTNGNKNGNLDAYSITYTTEHILGVWMGNKDNKLMSNKITGGTYPTIYCREMLKELYKDSNPKNFTIPNGIVSAKIDENTLYNDQKEVLTDSDNGVNYYYISGTEPKAYNNSQNIKNTELINVKISIKNGVVTIDVIDNDYKTLKIIKNYKKTNQVVYNGKFISQFKETLYDFGEYEYFIEIKNKEGVVYKTSLPKIKFDKSSLSIINDNWWEN